MPTGKSLRLFRQALSGHSHRVELALSLLGLPHELVDVDLARHGHVRGWLARIEALEGFVPFERSRVGLAA